MRLRSTLAVSMFLITTSAVASPRSRDVNFPLRNWSVPSAEQLRVGPNAALSNESSFIAIQPCRAVDTRGIDPGAFGGPIVADNSYRSWILKDAPNCSVIPATVKAYSTNVAVFGSAPGTTDNFIKAFPTGGTEPNNSTVNFVGGQTLSNAAIIPSGTPAGSITIYSNHATHVIIDVNGYFVEPVITGVTAGPGLTGGGTAGSVVLSANFTPSGGMNGTATTVARGDHKHYVQTVIVNPGASAAASGTALLNALSGITDASPTKPYLLKIEPGVYDLGTGSLTMKPNVDIEGSGENATIITRAGFPFCCVLGTVNGSDSAELRFLTVENSGGSTYGIAMSNNNVSPKVTHVTLRSLGGSVSSSGLYNVGNTAKGRFDSVTVLGSGSAGNYGIVNDSNSAATIVNSTITAIASGTAGAAGVWNSNSSASPTIVNSFITASGGSTAEGIQDQTTGTVTLEADTISAGGGTSSNSGIDQSGGTLLVSDSNISASGTLSRGLQLLQTASQVTVDRATIKGATNSVLASIASTARFGAARLDGTVSNTGGATLTCVASYNGTFVALTTACN